MSGHGGGSDIIQPPKDGGDGGGAANFNMGDLSSITKMLPDIFKGAQQTVDKLFGPASSMLPFGDGKK